MKKKTAISCLAIIYQLFIGFNGYSQINDPGIEILQQPVFEPVCAGEDASLNIQAMGSGLTYQWEVFKRWGNYEDVNDTLTYSGSRTTQLNIASLSKSMNQYLYRCKISNGIEDKFTRPAVVELKNALINIDPATGTGYVGDYHSIEVYATGEGLSFQWQVDKGVGFTNVEEDGTYEGSKTAILSIPKVARKMESYHYRCIVSGKACEEVTLVSKPASLRVSTNQNPVKSGSGGNPGNVIWYMDGMPQEVTFFGNPMVYLDGAVQVVNNSQLLSQVGTGPSCEITMTGHLFNDNPVETLLTPGDISKFIFTGSDDQEINGGNETKNNFYKIKIGKSSNTGALTLNNAISLRSNLELGTGDLNIKFHKIFLNYVNSSFEPQTLVTATVPVFPTIINETEDNSILGTSGSVVINDQLIGNSSPFVSGLNPGNIGAEIRDPNNDFAAKRLTIERVQASQSIIVGSGQDVMWLGTSIKRYYTISSVGDTPNPLPIGMDFTFHYLDGEREPGESENNLSIFKSDDDGITWAAQSTDLLNTTANFARQNQVEDITTRWALFPCLDVPIVAFAEGTQKHLCDGIDYAITPGITGGTATTAYRWTLDGTEVATTSTYSVTGVPVTANQTLIIKAFNAAGCFTSDTLTLIHEPALSIDLGPSQALCQGPTVMLSVSIQNAVNYEWKVDGSQVQNGTNGSFEFITNNFAPGDYLIEVTASTAFCSILDNVNITINPLPVANLGPGIVACAPGTTTLDANPSGGLPPYDFNWNNTASTQQITVNLANTIYLVTVTDANNCSNSAGLEMSFSDITLTQTHSDINCFSNSNGAINLTVTGNNGALQYIWSNGATTEDLTDVPPGTYTVTVTDAIFCSKTLSLTLTQPAEALTLSSTVANILCNGDGNGAIDLAVNGGTPGYTYVWSTGATTQDLTGLSGGTYLVTLTDSHGCTATKNIAVFEPDPFAPPPFPQPTITAVTCNGAGNGVINWQISGGKLPYTFSWTGPAGFTANTEDISSLGGGTYNVTATDANNCTYSTSFLVPEPVALAAIVSPNNVSCFGVSDGFIILSPSGGTAPYNHIWTGPNGFSSQAKNIFSLQPGNYNVTITDAHSCELVPATVAISTPSAPLSVTPTVTNSACAGSNNGSITTVTTGGWPPYTYSWLDQDDNDISTQADISFLGPGVYQLTLVDANSCVISEAYTITEPDAIILNETVTDISCNGNSDGSISLNVSGGTGSYTYHWQWAGGSSTAGFIENLGGPTQSYSVSVTDANNCIKTAIFEIIEPAAVTATSVVQNISCAGSNDGSINLTPVGNSLGFTFSWTGPSGFTSANEDIYSLAPGDYAVTLTDVNNCDSPGLNFTITEPTQLTANPFITNPLKCFEDSDGQMNAGPSGGTPPYSYLWTYPDFTTTATTQFISNLSQTGFYRLEVIDANGCHNSPGQLMIELTRPSILLTSGLVTDANINGGSDGAIDLSVSGGTGTYAYLWSNGATTADISGLSSATYTVTVTDANMCEKTESFVVNEPDLLTIAVEDSSNVSCDGGNNGFISTIGTGGVPPYNFSWSTGGTSFEIADLVAGDYTLTLTDAKGAAAIKTFTVTEPDPLTDGAVVELVSCFGANDGSIALLPTGGTSPYQYNWSNSATTNSITDLAPGDYSVTIIDDNNCAFSNTYTITEPNLLTATSTTTNANCFGFNDGSIILTANGIPPYSFNWSTWSATGSGTGTTIPDLFAGTYSITLTDDKGCTAFANATISQFPQLNVFISGNAVICEGESSILDAGAGFTAYEWSTGETTQTVTVTTSDVYSVTVTGPGCSASDDYTVTVSPLPTLIVNSVICAADFLSYDVQITTNAFTVSSDFGILTNNGGGSFTLSGLPAGQDVTITTDSNDPPCTNIVVVSGPSCICPVTFDDPPDLCAGSLPVDLTAFPTGGTFTGTGVSGLQFDPVAAGVGVHSLTYTYSDGNGCTNFTTQDVEVFALPTVLVGSNSPVCEGESLSFTETGGQAISWSWTGPQSFNSTNQNPGVFSSIAFNSGTYFITITDDNGCKQNSSVEATVHPAPNIAATSNAPLCEGLDLQLFESGNEAVSWSWAGPNGFSSSQQNPLIPNASSLQSGVYALTITDGIGCTQNTSVEATVHPTPNVAVSSNAPLCEGLDLQLFESGNEAVSWSWMGPNGFSSTQQNPLLPQATPLQSGAYHVTATDGNGCSATEQVLVIVNPLPAITVNEVICESNLLEYRVGITTDAEVVTTTQGTVSNLGGGSFLIENVPAGENITITAIEAGTACQIQQGINAPNCSCPPVNPPVSGGNKAICVGEPIPILTVTVNPGETASWYNAPVGGDLLASGTTAYIPTAAGTFYVAAVNSTSNCASTIRTPITLTIQALPVANAGADVTICSGTGVQLDARGSTGSGGLAFSWSPSTGLNNINIANPFANPIGATTYTVLVTNGVGCSSSDEVLVSVAPLPTITIDLAVCSPDLLTYEVDISTNAETLSSSAGTVTYNGGDSYSIIGIPSGQDVLLTITNTTTGCILLQSVTAPECNCPVVETPISNDDQEICVGEPIPALSVSVNDGETVDWYTAPAEGTLLLASSASYTPTEAGIFYAEARNTNSGCTGNARVAVMLTVNPLPALTFDDLPDQCAGNLPVDLTAFPTGGTFSGIGVSGLQFDPAAAGVGVHSLTYTFTDENGCTNFATQDVEVFAVPAVLAESNSPVCSGGDLLLMESGGDGTAWTWTGPNGFVSMEQNPVVPSLTSTATGVYGVIVTNARGCVDSASFTVELNPALGLSLSPAPAAFCPGSNVQLVATTSGGDGLYDYAWTTPSGSDSGQVIVADEEGTWSLTVTDGSSCTIAGSVSVSELPAMAIAFTSMDASCNSSNGALTATVTGGLPPYTYQWDGLPDTTDILTGVLAGNYQLMVTDGAGCVFSATGIVGNTDAPVVSLDNIIDVTCAGTATGSITVNVSGGSLPYTFNWTNGAQTQNISGLTAGQYGLELTDALGCGVNNLYQVTEPTAIVGVLVTTQTSTPAAADGAIDLSVTGGTPPYQFAWSNGLTSEDISNLFVGPYNVTITDANGCSVIHNTEITALDALTANLIGQNISCNGEKDGSIEVVISGGLMPYSILWSTGSILPVINNLLPGSYQVTVTGQNGSTATNSITLTQPPLLQSFTQQTDNLCSGGSNGAASVITSGGTTPYTYAWSNGGTDSSISEISAGNYTVTVTDNNGCTNQHSVAIGEPPALQIAIDSITDNACFGSSLGAIHISVSGGDSPYFANWSQGATTQDISGLPAGTYTVTITDIQTCTATSSVVVGESTQIDISFDNTGVTCFGAATGILTAHVSGGTPSTTGYQFNWSNGLTTATIGNLVSDNYFVTVTDEMGCSSVNNDFVAQPNILLGNLMIENISCFGLANGKASVQPTGGTMPYSYLWNNGATGSFIEDLATGQYSVVVTDVAGCSTVENLQITEPALLTVATAVTDLNCFNDFTGAIDLDISGGTPLLSGGYNIFWNIGQFNEDIEQLESGDYLVTISDDNGCEIQKTITVAQPAAILVEESISNVSCFGGNDGSIVLSVIGGNGPYFFNWQNGDNTFQITGLEAGNYSGTITDNHGCILTMDSEVKQSELLAVESHIQRAGCKTTDDGSIDITVTGGVPDYTFNWSNGAVSEDVSQLTAGTYAVTVTDGNGCTVSQSLTVAGTDSTFNAHFLAASGLFDVDSVEVFSDDIIQFVDISLPSPISWQWFFGDPASTTSNIPNPAFSYPDDEMAPQTFYFATLVASNLFCTDTMTKKIWITNNFRLIAPKEDSLSYLSFTDILAYPNPTTGLVKLDIKLSRKEKVRVYVVNVLGKVLEQSGLEGKDHYLTELNFTGWGPGIYFINLRSVNRVHTVKVLVSDE